MSRLFAKDGAIFVSLRLIRLIMSTLMILSDTETLFLHPNPLYGEYIPDYIPSLELAGQNYIHVANVLPWL